MALSQLTFVIKTNYCIQQETSITLKCYSAGDVNLFSSTVYTEIRSIEVFHVLSFSEFIGKRGIFLILLNLRFLKIILNKCSFDK